MKRTEVKARNLELNGGTDLSDAVDVDPDMLEGFDPNEHLSASMDVKVDGEIDDTLIGGTVESVTIETSRSWWERLFSWPWRPWVGWERRYTFDARVVPRMEGHDGDWQRVTCDVEPVGPIAVQTWDGKLLGPKDLADPPTPDAREDE